MQFRTLRQRLRAPSPDRRKSWFHGTFKRLTYPPLRTRSVRLASSRLASELFSLVFRATYNVCSHHNQPFSSFVCPLQDTDTSLAASVAHGAPDLQRPDTLVFRRYCHLFVPGELEACLQAAAVGLVASSPSGSQVSVKVLRAFSDGENLCVHWQRCS